MKFKKSRKQLLKERDPDKPKYPELGGAGVVKEYWDCYFDSQEYEDEKHLFKLVPKDARTK